LDIFTASGRIQRIEQKTSPNGSPMTVLTVPVNQGQDQQGNEKTLWVEITGWDKDAERYAESFAEGDWVSFSGRLEVAAYEKTRGGGGVGISCRLTYPKVLHLPNNRTLQAMRLMLEQQFGVDLRNDLRPWLDRVSGGERAGGVAAAPVGTGYPGGVPSGSLDENVPF
jgi:hypothetical protein